MTTGARGRGVWAAGEALKLLRRHVSGINASVIVEHALAAAKLRAGSDNPSSGELVSELDHACAIFLSPSVRGRILADLRKTLAGYAPSPDVNQRAITIAGEADLRAVRQACRDLCDQLGLLGPAAQRVTAVAGELAQNIADYAGRGELLLTLNPVRRSIEIQALNSGPGPGLGSEAACEGPSGKAPVRGIFRVQKLADELEIENDSDGTRVRAHIRNL